MTDTTTAHTDGRQQPSEHYYRVHRSYMLTAGLLAAWEILGVSPRTSEESSGVDAALGVGVVTDVRVSFDSPEAAVYVLVALLMYFAVRFGLVWLSEPMWVRTGLAVRTDYLMAHGVAVAALSVGSMSVYFAGYRLGEVLTEVSGWVSVGATVFAALGLASQAAYHLTMRRRRSRSKTDDGVGGAVGAEVIASVEPPPGY